MHPKSFVSNFWGAVQLISIADFFLCVFAREGIQSVLS